MITVTKTILALSALASAGAWTVVEPTAAVRTHVPASAIIANGKVVDRMPMVEGGLSSEQILVRIRSAHGLPTKVAAVDCKLFAWPNIPAECISASGGDTPRQVRVISTDARPAGQAAPAPTTAALPARVIR
jgi:hypothetical protein